MTRSELIEEFAKNAEISRNRAATFVAAFFDALSESLRLGKRVELRTFGNFSVRRYEGYIGRNPKSGAKVFVPKKRLPYFKPSIVMCRRLNGKKEGDD